MTSYPDDRPGAGAWVVAYAVLATIAVAFFTLGMVAGAML